MVGETFRPGDARGRVGVTRRCVKYACRFSNKLARWVVRDIRVPKCALNPLFGLGRFPLSGGRDAYLSCCEGPPRNRFE